MTPLTRRDALTGAATVIAGTALPAPPAADAAPLSAGPLAELDAHDDDYDLTIWLTVGLDRYSGGAVAAGIPTTIGAYCLEADRMAGAWQLRLRPWNGSLQGDDGLTGPPLVELKTQTTGPDPLTLLQALLAGQAI